ncbi:hypothetical protein [Streptomyces sp. NPDC006285]|uniref:hypothetical protein n=1 Tax=Streptomyces sp. NPDC006285 TaxID=3364742 RepID=UPI0036746C83
MDTVLYTPDRPYDPHSPLADLMEIAAEAVDEASEEEDTRFRLVGSRGSCPTAAL